jgi:nicotinate-nucleotide--dimethylbenzimidazole phosphoribosyltransferase
MEKIEQTVASIHPLDEKAMEEARRRQESLTKPRGSLGQLESLSVQIAGISGNRRPQIVHKVIFTLAGDHGITQEGVSAYPSEVTPQMVYNFLRGGAGINVLARLVGARVVVADLGVVTHLKHHLDLKEKKVAPGPRTWPKALP